MIMITGELPMKTVFITNTDGTLGLSFVHHYVIHGAHVFAACPNPATADKLHLLAARYPGQITIVALDVINRDQITAARSVVQSKTDVLDILINNTEMNSSLFLDSLENASYAFRMNAIAPIMIARRFADLLQRSESPRVANIASNDLSFFLADTLPQQAYTYNTGKDALRLYTEALTADMALLGIQVLMLDVGCLQSSFSRHEETALRPILANTVQRITAQIDCPPAISSAMRVDLPTDLRPEVQP
jgi:NAD(P)-dependent dehydrogenase (short-subunit alcohol dehydrogenase family)